MFTSQPDAITKNLHATMRTGTNMQEAKTTVLCQGALAFVLKKAVLCVFQNVYILPPPSVPDDQILGSYRNSLIHIVIFDFLAVRTKNSITLP
jgi:hypothetical protein